MNEASDRALFAKVVTRLIPFLFLLYIVAISLFAFIGLFAMLWLAIFEF